MKNIYKIILVLMCIFVHTGINAQISVSRGALPTQVNSCNSITLNYNISSNSFQSQIIIAESFNLNGCTNPIQNVNISGYPAALASASISPSGGFNFTLNNVQGGSQQTITLTITFRANPANRRVRICSQPLVVTSLPNVTKTINAPSGCIIINNTHSWRSNISCAQVTGTNCRTYSVDIRDYNCGANGYGTPKFRFSVPTGGIITNILSTQGVNSITGLNSNVVNFNSNISNWIAGSTNQLITFEVKYPCNIIPIGSSVTANFEHLWNSNPNVNYGPSCGITPTEPIEKIQITASSITHNLQAPVIADELSFKQENLFDNSKHSPGCSSRIRINYQNTGSTTIDNLTIDLPIPNQITLNSICPSPSGQMLVKRFQKNSVPNWIIGVPSLSETSSVTRLELGWNVNNIGLAPQSECNTGSASSPANRFIDLCFQIKSNTSVGSMITFNSNYNSSDIVTCIASGCPQYIPQTSTGNATYAIRVQQPTPRPSLNKTMSPSIIFPGEFTTIELLLRNSGSGNLVTNITDVLAAHFDNISIQSIEYSAAGAAFGSPPLGIISSQNVTLNSTTQESTVNVGVNIPGICTLDNSGSCCDIQFNSVRIRIKARVKPCTVAKSNIDNRSDITGFNMDLINPPGNNHRVRYHIRNFNQIQITKEGRGNAATDFSNTLTQVTPGGNLDYKIKVRNTNPQPWNGLVVADLMPRIGDTNLCSTTPRGSQFDAELIGPVMVTLNNCPGITGHNITYTNNNINSNIQDVCGTGQLISSPTVAGNNKGFQVKFTGAVDCGCEIDINVPAKVVTTAGLTGGEKAINQVVFKTTENNLPAISSMDAEILTWKLECCKEGDIKLEKFTVLETVREPEFNAVAFNYQLSTNSTIPIKEVRMSIIDFDFRGENPECEYCYNKSSSLGSFRDKSGWAWDLPNHPTGSLAPGLIVKPQTYFIGQDTWNVGREIIWGLGTPLNLSGGEEIRAWLNIPLQRNLDCCKGGEIYVCFKVEVTDVNCNTCEIIRCETIPWRTQSPK